MLYKTSLMARHKRWQPWRHINEINQPELTTPALFRPTSTHWGDNDMVVSQILMQFKQSRPTGLENLKTKFRSCFWIDCISCTQWSV